MDLVKAGETAQVTILGETFHVKVMSVFEAAEWSQKFSTADTADPVGFITGLADKIEKIDGFSEKPIELLKKLANADDLVEIVKGIMSGSGLGDSEVKNSNSSSEQVTTSSSEVVEKTVVEEESPVSATVKPEYR